MNSWQSARKCGAKNSGDVFGRFRFIGHNRLASFRALDCRYRELCRSAGLSVVNLAEIASKLSDWQMSDTQLSQFLTAIDIAILPFDAALAYETGRLRAVTRHYGLSLGDRACLATAMQLAVPAITADRKWQHLKIGAAITVIR